MLRNKKGITLIALVVTIVVLLILAGVTISLLLDENGIIAKSKDARTETRVSQIEDEVGMWKQHNFINKESNQAQENADTMLANLISRKLLTEDEIDRDQELITIKKKDGTIIKEISYSSVTINISKTSVPATEKASGVLLTVDSVDGLTSFDGDDEEGYNKLVDTVQGLSEERKKEIIRLTESVSRSRGECTTFEEMLEWHKTKGHISEATEDAFWSYVTSGEGIDSYTMQNIDRCCIDREKDKLNLYIVINPDGLAYNGYETIENGTFEFKVYDIITGKTYTKKVEVSNIDTTATATYEVYDVTESRIGLRNKETKQPTTFSKIYNIYMDEIFNSEHDRIETADDGTYNYAKLDYGYIRLAEKGEVIFLEKDGILYAAKVKIHRNIH